MALSNLEVRQIAREVEALVGSRFQRAQRTPKGYRIKLQAGEVMASPPEAVYITHYPIKGETDGLSAFLKKRLAGSRLESVAQHGLDRVLTLGFDNGWSIVIELFSTGNIIAVDPDGATGHALRYQSWSDREIKPKRLYKYPSSRGLDPTEMTEKEFEKVFDRDAIRSMARGIKMGGKYLELACESAGVDKEAEPSKADVKRLFKAVKGLVDREAEPGLQPGPVLFPLRRQGFEPADSLSAAVDEYYAKPEPERHEESRFSHRLGEQEKALSTIREDAERFKEMGDWLQTHAQQVDSLSERVKELRKQGLSDAEISRELGVNARVKGKKLYLAVEPGKKQNKASADAN